MGRRTIAIALSILGLMVVVLLAARFYLTQAIEDRTGCVGDWGTLDIWSGSPRVTGLNIHCPRGDAQLDSLTLHGDLIAFFRGRVRLLEVRGGRVMLVAATTGDVSLRATDRPASTRPQWTLADVDVVVSSGQSTLLEGHVAHAEGSSVGLEAEVSSLSTSDAHSPFVRAEHLRVSLVHGEGWQVSSLEVDGLDVRFSDAPALRDALGSGSATRRVDSSSSSWLGRFTNDAQVHVRDATVHDEQGVAVSSLTVRGARRADDLVSFEGTGSPRGAGRLGWDVRVRPSTLEAEGTVELERVPLSLFTVLWPTVPVERAENTLVSGRLELRTLERRVDFEGNLAVAGLTLVHSRLAAEAVTFDLSAAGAGHWDRDAHQMVLERATLGLGRAEVSLAGRVMRDGERYAADVDVTLPPTSCQAAVSSIPRGLLQDAGGWGLEGSISGHAHLSVDSERLDETRLQLGVNEVCRFTGVPALADINRFRGPFRHVVNEPDGSVFEMETGPGTPEWTPIYEVSPFLVHAVIAHEDAAFFRHSGFAPWAIRDALVRNLRERRYVLGASTITMQLVKNVFLRREKTLARKVQEVLLTWWIERSMTKEQILELYLNVIEYGPRVYGVRHAASHYFGRTPAELTPAQAAYLAMILPNPPSFYEQYESGAVPASFARRVQRFLATLRERGRVDEDAFQVGVEELAAMQFSRDGARVGPEIRGACAPLPIAGFSGMPLVEWSGGEPEVDDNEDEPPADDWEVRWP